MLKAEWSGATSIVYGLCMLLWLSILYCYIEAGREWRKSREEVNRLETKLSEAMKQIEEAATAPPKEGNDAITV